MRKVLSRIFSYAFKNFFRNAFISFSTIFITTTALFVVGLSLLANILLTDIVDGIKERVDITVYFKTTTDEEAIIDFKSYIEELEGVKDVLYVSRNEALVEYRKRHATDIALIEGLEELETNPLRARLHVSAEDTIHYEAIAGSIRDRDLFSDAQTSLIDKINFFENQLVIDRLSNSIRLSEIMTLTVLAILITASFIISFMTIRITIYTNREELKLMKLVGASRLYSEGPFIIEGVFYGAISGITATALLYPFSLWAGNLTENFLGGFNILFYYTEHVAWLMGILVLIGVSISVLSALLSLLKKLK